MLARQGYLLLNQARCNRVRCKCGELYYRNISQRKNGCLRCRNAYQRMWRKGIGREKNRESAKRYWLTHNELRKKYRQAWIARNPDKAIEARRRKEKHRGNRYPERRDWYAGNKALNYLARKVSGMTAKEVLSAEEYDVLRLAFSEIGKINRRLKTMEEIG